MGKLTIDIPGSTHNHIKVLAAQRGMTIKDYVLDKLMPELDAGTSAEPSLRELASAWEARRAEFKLERGGQSVREVLHDGHRW